MGNDLSSIINLGHQSIATTPIKVIVETSHDSQVPLISALSLNPTKQYWSELCHHFITYDYPTSFNTRLLNLLKDIYPTARLSTYKLRFHNGYCTIIKPKWSSNYDIDIPRIDAYLDVNVSFCDINNPKRFGPYDTICRGLLRGMDRNSTPEEKAARLRRPRVTLQIVKLYGMENNELGVDCTPYPIYKELTKVLYITERDEYQGYCEDIQVKDALIDGDVMGYKHLFPKICKEQQQVKRVDVSEGNDVEMKRVDASDEKPKAQDMATTKKDESSSSSDSSDSSDSESEDEEETNQSMAKKNEPQKKETSLVNEKVAVNKDESSSSSSDSDSESEHDKEKAKQSSTKDASSSSSSDSDSSDSSDSEEEEEVNVKDKQASKEATRKEDDKTLAKNQDDSSSSSSSSSDSSDSEDEKHVPVKKSSPSKAVSNESPTKEVAPTDKVSPQKKKVSDQKKTDVAQSKPNKKLPAKEKQVKTKATEPKKPTNSIQDTKVPARLKNKRKREQNATKENGDKTSSNNAGDQPKKKRKANIMTGRYAKEIAAAKSAAAKPSTINDHKKKSSTPKKKPDPNEPRRPKNGFYLFCDSVRAQMTAQNPGLPPKDIQVLMRKEYKSLSKSQLTAWKEVAKQAHEQYHIELEAYEKTPKKDD